MTVPIISQADVKLFTDEDFRDIFANQKFKLTPRLHQYATLLWGLPRDRIMLLHDIGTGKTLASLLLAEFWKCKKILVLCPNSVRRTWRDELAEHTNMTFVDLTGTTEERKKLARTSKALVHIINYEGLKLVWGCKVPISGKKGNRFVGDAQAILQAGYDCIIVDELHHLRTFNSVTVSVAYHLSLAANKIIMLSGTPTAKDVSEFWSECMVLDNGATLGNDWKVFLHEHFKVWVQQVGAAHFYNWSPKPGAKAAILDKVSRVALRYDASECVDLPPVTYQRRVVDMSAEQKKLVAAVVSDLKLELTMGQLTTKNALNKSAKLLQILGGTLILPKGTQILKPNPKLDELIRVFQEVAGKAICFHSFVAEGRIIEQRLKQEGIEFRAIRGEVTDRDKQITDFKENPDVKVLVAHPTCGGEGLNLQVANVIVYYSQVTSSAIIRKQTEGRIVRAGQTKPCVIIDLVARDPAQTKESVDERLQLATQDQKDLATVILDWIRDFGK